MTWQNVLRTAEKFVIDNSPGILTGLGVAGAVTTAVLTGQAAYRVGKDENAAHFEPMLQGNEPVNLTTKELVKIYWREFIPAGIAGVATVTAIIMANQIGSRRAAAITAAFKLSEQMTEEYKTRVRETLGKKNEDKIVQSLAEDRVRRTPGHETIIIAGSEAMFFDEASGRFFKNEMDKVLRAVNEINFQVNNNFYASLTDFYEKLGLPKTQFSDELGWNADTALEVEFSAVMMDDNRAAISMHYNSTPIRGFDRLQ